MTEVSVISEAKREGLAEGEAKGIEKGMAKGKKEGKLEIAKELKTIGMSFEQISEITKLSIEEIKKYKKILYCVL